MLLDRKAWHGYQHINHQRYIRITWCALWVWDPYMLRISLKGPLNIFFHRSHLNKVRGDAVGGAALDELALRRQEVFRVGVAELLPERAH